MNDKNTAETGFWHYVDLVIDTTIRFHPIYIVPFLAMGFAVYIYNYRNTPQKPGFWGWMFPKDMYFHPSHITDIKLFFFGRVLDAFGFLSMLFIQVFIAYFIMKFAAGMGAHKPQVTELTTANLILITLIVTIISDFCVYWVHRVHHERPLLWPFHSVHHSAEILTPITTYRKHPIYDLLSNYVTALLIGVAQGILLALFFGKLEIMLVAGANVIYVVFNMLGSNFRHSHIWLRYGAALEHIFISPAQHQIHHSLEPRHHNKNYGEVLAIWDWMFGTLYIPQGYEKLEFGISKSSTSNERIKQPHNTLWQALIVPFKDSWKVIKKDMKRAQKTKHTSPINE